MSGAKFTPGQLGLQDLVHCLLCCCRVHGRRPVSFPDCHHVFCSECLDSYRSHLDMATETRRRRLPAVQDCRLLPCPTCSKEAEERHLRAFPASGDAAHGVCCLLGRVKVKPCKSSTQRWSDKGCSKQYSDSTVGCSLQMVCLQHEKPPNGVCRDRLCDLELSCSKCATHKHRVEDLEGYLDEQRGHISKGVQCLRQSLDVMSRQVQQVGEIRKQRSLAKEQARNAISRHCDVIIRDINEQRRQLLDDVERFHESAQTVLRQYEDYLQYTVRRLGRLRDFSCHLAQPGQEPLLYSHSEVLTEHVRQNTASRNDAIQHYLAKVLSVPMFREQMINQHSQGVSLGSLHSSKITLPEPGGDKATRCAVAGCQVSDSRKLLWTMSVSEGSGDQGIRGKPCGLQHIHPDNLAVADKEAGKIHVMTSTGGYIGEKALFANNFLPIDVASLDSGSTIVVTDIYNATVKVKKLQNPSGKLERFLSRDFNRLASPHGVAADSYGHVIVTDILNSGVYLFNASNGSFIQELEPRRSGSIQEFVTCNPLRSRIAVTESDSHCVRLYDCRCATAVASFGRKGSDNGCLCQPAGICCDGHGNFVVADSGNNRVSLFDGTGRFLQHLVEFDKGEASPFGLSLSSDGELAVTDRLSDTVRVFQAYDSPGS